MATIEEKRVYGDRAGRTDLLVASELGVVVVGVAGDTVGEFRVARRCTARDVAAGSTVAVATDEDVLVAEAPGGEFSPTGFGPAVAVGAGDALLAAGPDGRVARRDGERWVDLGTADTVRAVDGPLVAAADGVYRVGEGLTHAGLDDARDVAAAGPLAATATGVYGLGNGWLDELAGDASTVAARGTRAHAVVDGALHERTRDGWRVREVPVAASPVDVAHGEAAYAVTADGTVLVDAGDGWRSRSLGVPGVAALAVAD
jgi:hypothetical protein